MQLISASGIPGPVMIVGDYPTQDEINNGTAFTGSTGRLMNVLLQPLQLDVHKLYATYYIKTGIPGYNSKIKAVKKAAYEKVQTLENWLSILKEEISIVKPNAILTTGELALQGLTGAKNIENYRGSILPISPDLSDRPINVLAIHSPREIWERNEVPFAYTQWDIQKLKLIKDLNIRFKPKELIWIVRHPQELINWWERAKHGKFLTIDIETHFGFITCIGFCHDGYEAISVPLLVGPSMDGLNKGMIWKLIRDIQVSPIPKVNQNIKYDWTVEQRWGLDIRNIVGDTMLMQCVIYPELPKGLDFLTSIYSDQPYYKSEGKEYDPRIHNVERLLIYNAKDALTAWQIWDKQQADAEAMGVKRFFFKRVMPSFFIFKRMDERGIRLDELQVNKLKNKYLPIYQENCRIINLIAGERINVLSPTQLGRFIYDILKCPKHIHTTDTGKEAYNTDEDTIEELYINEITDVGIKEILKRAIFARKLAKVVQFLNNPISPDGRMRTSFRLSWAKTGRNTAGKSLEKGYRINVEKHKIEEVELGGSFQTIPKHGFEFGPVRFGEDLRTVFIPSPGYSFVEGDQAQAEDRVVCVLAEDWEGLEVLNKTDFKYNNLGVKDDRHVLTAILITGKPFEEITKDDRQNLGKKPRHAGNYNMGPGMLSVFTHFPISQCIHIMEKFHQTSPKIRGIFHAQIQQLIDLERFLRTPHGRRRDFFGKVSEKMYKEAYSDIPQGTVSDHNKFTILPKLCEEFSAPIAYPVSEAHDSLTFEVLNSCKENFAKRFLEICKTPIDFIDCSLKRDYKLIIPGEVEIGELNWGEMRKWNP